MAPLAAAASSVQPKVTGTSKGDDTKWPEKCAKESEEWCFKYLKNLIKLKRVKPKMSKKKRGGILRRCKSRPNEKNCLLDWLTESEALENGVPARPDSGKAARSGDTASDTKFIVVVLGVALLIGIIGILLYCYWFHAGKKSTRRCRRCGGGGSIGSRRGSSKNKSKSKTGGRSKSKKSSRLSKGSAKSGSKKRKSRS